MNKGKKMRKAIGGMRKIMEGLSLALAFMLLVTAMPVMAEGETGDMAETGETGETGDGQEEDVDYMDGVVEHEETININGFELTKDGVLVDYKGKEGDNVKLAVPKQCREIGNNALVYVNAYSIMVPGTVKKIGAQAFQSSGLRKVIIKKGCIEIGDEAFRDCQQLESIKLPDGLKKIGNLQFTEDKNLYSLTIPGSVTSWGEELLWNSRVEKLTIKEGCKKIGKRAFAESDDLKKVKLPNSLTEIGEEAFGDSHLLSSVNLPKKLKKIGANAFHWTDIKKITVPKSVKTVGLGAFTVSGGLRQLTVLGKNLKTHKAFYLNKAGELLYLPKEIRAPKNSQTYKYYRKFMKAKKNKKKFKVKIKAV